MKRADVLEKARKCVCGDRVFGNTSVVYVSSTKQGTVAAQLDGLYLCR